MSALQLIETAWNVNFLGTEENVNPLILSLMNLINLYVKRIVTAMEWEFVKKISKLFKILKNILKMLWIG